MTLKLRKRSLFPALVEVTPPLLLVKVGSTYTFSFDANAAAGSLPAILQALAALDSTAGLLSQTGAATFAKRVLAGTANEITATNGDGVAGNPTLSLPAALTFTGKTVTGGTFNGGTFNSPTVNTPTIGTSATINMGADNLTGLTINGASGNGRLNMGTDGSGNALIRTQNSGQMRLGINSSDMWILTTEGAFSAVEIAAPTTPTSGFGKVYVDSTNSILSHKSDGGVVSSTVVPSSAVANQFVTGVSAAGVISRAQPAAANLSDGTVGTGSVVLGSAGQLPATATNNNANAGNVGEYVSSTVLVGSAIALTTATPTNITSISLTAGDWDVWINARFNGAATTTVSRLLSSISATSATLSATPGMIGSQFYNNATVFNVTVADVPVGPVRMTLSATTTVFLVGQADFGVSTCSAFGVIQARRRR